MKGWMVLRPWVFSFLSLITFFFFLDGMPRLWAPFGFEYIGFTAQLAVGLFLSFFVSHTQRRLIVDYCSFSSYRMNCSEILSPTAVSQYSHGNGSPECCVETGQCQHLPLVRWIVGV